MYIKKWDRGAAGLSVYKKHEERDGPTPAGCRVSCRRGRGRRTPRPPGFTVVEMMTVLAILGIILVSGVVAFSAATRRADVSAVTEMVKQDLRNVYMLANSGKRDPDTTGTPRERIDSLREQYRITFNRSTDNPPNAYLVEKRVWDGSDWGDWTSVKPHRAAANRVVTVGENHWIRPSSSSDMQLTYSDKTVHFIPRGSIIWTGAPGGTTTGIKEVTVASQSQNRQTTIYISPYGSISEG